jgi:hypothetical protein
MVKSSPCRAGMASGVPGLKVTWRFSRWIMGLEVEGR